MRPNKPFPSLSYVCQITATRLVANVLILEKVINKLKYTKGESYIIYDNTRLIQQTINDLNG